MSLPHRCFILPAINLQLPSRRSQFIVVLLGGVATTSGIQILTTPCNTCAIDSRAAKNNAFGDNRRASRTRDAR
jgi:hypothetical protein